jgi:hypothetical protein
MANPIRLGRCLPAHFTKSGLDCVGHKIVNIYTALERQWRISSVAHWPAVVIRRSADIRLAVHARSSVQLV